MDLVNANSKNPQVIKAIAFFIHSIKVEYRLQEKSFNKDFILLPHKVQRKKKKKRNITSWVMLPHGFPV